MGADYGRGKKTQLFSSFLMGVRQGSNIIPISRVGTGFTDDDLEELT
jgi:ATP-dependent DNA ligase